MPTAIDKILDSIKRFEAQNASLSPKDEDLLDRALPGTATSHAPCYTTYKQSMKILVGQWKKKVAQLKAAGDPAPEINAAKAMEIQFKNIGSTLARCLRQPLHKLKTPSLKDKF
jgi:hypothetical protein